MSLNANALTSVANAKLWLRRNNETGTPSTDDTTLLTLLINSVSSAVIRYTGREFIATDDQARTFEYLGGGFLNIYPYELRSVSSITFNGATLTASTGIGDGDYALYPRNQTADGTYLYLKLKDFLKVYPATSLQAPVLNERDVVITGNWGMGAVPADVELATLIAVADLYRNPEQGQTRGVGEFQVAEVAENPGSDESLPWGALRLLEPFVRPVVG